MTPDMVQLWAVQNARDQPSARDAYPSKKGCIEIVLGLGTPSPKKTHLVCNRQYYTYRYPVQLSSLAHPLYEIHVTNRRKVILFYDWLSTSWLIELFVGS